MAQSHNNDHGIIEHASRLQQSLISVQNEIDNHKSTQAKWDSDVLSQSGWIEKNFNVTLGSFLSTALENINKINREGGPGQNNVHLIAKAVLYLAKFIGSLLDKNKRGSS